METGIDSKGFKASEEILEDFNNKEGLGEEQENRHSLSMDIISKLKLIKTTNKYICTRSS